MTADLTDPAHLRALAAQAEELARWVAATSQALKRGDESRRRAADRLDQTAWQAGRVAGDLADVAALLARAAGRRAVCGMDGRVCPEHGRTLMDVSGKLTCRVEGCGRTWPRLPSAGICPEPVRYLLTDGGGYQILVCTGHALAARAELPAARLHALPERAVG